MQVQRCKKGSHTQLNFINRYPVGHEMNKPIVMKKKNNFYLFTGDLTFNCHNSVH